jgi:hypothetical protein
MAEDRMTRTNLIDTRTRTRAHRLFPKTCTIQSMTAVAGGVGQGTDGFLSTDREDDAAWADVLGLIDVPCSAASASGQEIKRSDQTVDVNRLKVCLKGYFPEITEEQALVLDSVRYNIQNVNLDSRGLLTYVEMEDVA